METLPQTVFIKCKTCGKHILKEEAFNKIFCSLPCSKSFTQCCNCGKYFIGDSEYCSPECSTNFENKIPD